MPLKRYFKPWRKATLVWRDSGSGRRSGRYLTSWSATARRRRNRKIRLV
jgi:hypothetical protein